MHVFIADASDLLACLDETVHSFATSYEVKTKVSVLDSQISTKQLAYDLSTPCKSSFNRATLRLDLYILSF